MLASAQWRGDTVILWEPMTRRVRRFAAGTNGAFDARSTRFALAAESEVLLGEHTFRAFAKAHTAPVDDDHRCIIQDARWTLRDGGWEFEIEANRFLHHMVRFLVGTMIDVGTGRRPRGTVARLLNAPDNIDTSSLAPPHALSLRHVRYPADLYLASA